MQYIRGTLVMVFLAFLGCATAHPAKKTPERRAAPEPSSRHQMSAYPRTLPHKDYVRLGVVTSNGTLAATWARDGLRVWDVAAGHMRCHIRLPGTKNSPGRRLASIDILVGDLPTDMVGLGILDEGGEARVLVTLSREGWLRFHDARSCALMAEILAHPDGATWLSAPGGSAFATSGGKTVALWQGWDAHAPVQTISHRARVYMVMLSTTPALLALMHGEQQFRWAEARKGPEFAKATVMMHAGEAIDWSKSNPVSLDASNELLAIASLAPDRAVYMPDRIWIWSTRDGSRVAEVDLHHAVPRHLFHGSPVAFATQGRSLVLVATAIKREISSFGPTWTDNKALVYLPLNRSGVVSLPLDVGVIETDSMQKEYWVFDRMYDPSYLLYGDQDGSVAVVRLADRQPIFVVDEHAYRHL